MPHVFHICRILPVLAILLAFAATAAADQPDKTITEKSSPHRGPAWDLKHGDLRVSDDHRYLVHADGTPFFFLGDTAWELFHRADRDAAEFFLETRRSQGFTVIQAVALAEFGGLTRPNPYGHTPLLDNNPATPEVKDGPGNDYWDHVDFVIQTAAKKGLYIGLLPTWGDKVNQRWGEGPEIFNEENARAYGKFLGTRYADTPNLIWILGGDRDADDRHKRIWRAMAEGIKEGDKGRHLMTYHPMGGRSSSEWVHDETWLDFNMQQSGHGAKNIPNFRKITDDYNREPTKPVLDGEPCYDNHPVRDNSGQWFDDQDVRQEAYWSLLAGSCGHTYGCHDIWQLYDGTPESRCTDPRTPWREAIHLPGAWDMLHVRRLMLSRPFPGRTPAQDILVENIADGPSHRQAILGKDGAYAFIYTPDGTPITLKTERFSGESLTFTWFNPRTGELKKIGTRKKADIPTITLKTITLTPPGQIQRGNDWVLIVDDAGRKFKNP